jgi:8-oxo-dGTP pyrophosphatase MutT (NUDIX family)
MTFDPQKFFIGLVDFFSVLLPGALLTYLLIGDAWPVVPLNGDAHLDRTQTWAFFLFSSYLVGHLVFLLGAWWLDDFYDWARRQTLNNTSQRVATRDVVPPWYARMLVWLVFKREANAAVECAASLKRETLKPVNGARAVNTFQWAKALLTVESPESLATVQRFEADSKFFRSFVVVLLILVAWWSAHRQWTPAGVAFALTPLALWRYMDQRLKSTNQAYWSVITLAARSGKVVAPPQRSVTPDGETHAGGVVYRQRWFDKCRYLLVEARANPGRWVLPKGHIEPGESLRETAVREVHEEAGIWAVIESDLGIRTFPAPDNTVRARFFLMRARGRGLKADRDRLHRWVRFEQAVALASFEETRELLRQAEAVRRRAQVG